MAHADHDTSLVGDAISGAVAGCVATVPMTWAMEMMHRRLPRTERYPLPPRQVTMRITQQAGVQDRLDEHERLGLTLLAHFGMGTAAGSAYGLLGSRLPLPAPLAGAAFGLAVWAGNYLGLLPALGLLRPATEHPPRRTAVMIAAHLVWGAVVGVLASRSREGERSPAAK